MTRLLLWLIRIYQATISPLLGNCCRFYPSCSHYTHEAIEKHGLVKGFWFASKRIIKCGPWHPGGIDEVPQKQKKTCYRKASCSSHLSFMESKALPPAGYNHSPSRCVVSMPPHLPHSE